MLESLRIFGLLLYKNWLVRKKQIGGTLIKEMLFPLGLVALIWILTAASKDVPDEVDYDSYYKMQSLDELKAAYPSHMNKRFLVAPYNKFMIKLFAHVQDCLNTDVGPLLRPIYLNNEKEIIKVHFQYPGYYAMAVIFDMSTDYSTKQLRYKFRNIATDLDLHNDKTNPDDVTKLFTTKQPFAQLQICIDRSFVFMKDQDKRTPGVSQIHIQRVPYPAHTKEIPFNSVLRDLLPSMLYIAFICPILTEVSKSSDEKFSGVNVLMSINGISNALNLLSWIFTGIIILSIIFVLPVSWLLTHSAGSEIAFLHYGNPFILFLILMLHTAHFLTFGTHLSAYFSSESLISTAVSIVIVFEMVAKDYFFTANTRFLTPFVGVVLPGFLFFQAIDEIQRYEILAEGVHWYNLFINANPEVKIGGSIGMIFILSIIGCFVHFLLAVYIYAIHPGKYGTAKHPLFCLKFKGKSNDDDDVENFEYDDTNGQFFESIPPDVYIPGIQIRNLKKSYNVSLFSKEKVHALRGVSIDFYKGQITSLLGHNGAGKTTMMSILTGMTGPSDGSVFINGKNLKDNASEIMNDMGLCPQENMYFSTLTVSEQLTFFAMVKRKDKSKSEIRQDVQNLLEKLKLTDKRYVLPMNLSGGQKRRVCLGMALIGDSSILILDEPTSGLDPENRRVIWDTLLKMRGEKTILISTHNMEEADILGDRIAIMHTGQLKSYGTSLFLKRLLGQNSVEITLSIEPGSDPEKIRSSLNKDGIIVSSEPGKIVVRIPNTPGLPDILDNLEKAKKDLRVTGFSVSLISMEQVFLKMTEDDHKAPEPRPISEEAKLTDNELRMQTVRALLSKKLLFSLKDYHTVFVKIFMAILSVTGCATMFSSIDLLARNEEQITPIVLDMYPYPHVLYTSYDKSFGDQYKAISESFGANSIKVSDVNLESALLNRARDNLPIYDNYMIAAAEFNKTGVNAFYSETAMFSMPISINLVWNAFAKTILGDDYSISISWQDLPDIIKSYLDVSFPIGLATSIIFTCAFCSTVALYVKHPRGEAAFGFKQIQLMTGVSGFIYWGTMFIIDMLEYVLLVVFIMVYLSIFDLSMGLGIYGFTEIAVHSLILVLFGINAVLLAYICSFLNVKSDNLVNWLTYLPLGLAFVDIVMYAMSLRAIEEDFVYKFYPIYRKITRVVPYLSFVHAQMSFLYVALSNARCFTMTNEFYDTYCKVLRDRCCNMNCYDGKCEYSMPYFEESEFNQLNNNLTYLCLLVIFYIAILAMLESRIIKKMYYKSKNAISKHTPESNDDEQVQREKSKIYKRIQTLSGKSEDDDDSTTLHIEDLENFLYHPVFFVYELQKSYGSVKAVKDVSFGVNRGICFGLLGVNGSGKSTTFRMMTGAEFPDRGVMYMDGVDFENHEKYFLSQMAYCPQHDALLYSMNAYHHLRLFARLRGIAEDEVENEIEAWIERLNLSRCASQPCGTYSGGNKRRLNIAIALIGNPNLILMDEPTTGVDPQARRSLWNVIKSCQMAGQTFILASHSMEECEALCNRLAIMAAGKLVCIGASEELKQRFGAGYDIQMKLDPEKAKDQIDNIKADMEKALRCELVDENMGYLMYHVEVTGTTWRKMYDVMNGLKNKYNCIEDFSILSASLEKLFLMFAKTASSSTAENQSNLEPDRPVL